MDIQQLSDVSKLQILSNDVGGGGGTKQVETNLI